MTGDHAWVVHVRGRCRILHRGVEITLRPKERAVLASLARRQGTRVTTDQIVEDVWGEHPPATVNKSVHNHIARLRRAAPDLIETVEGHYQLGAGAHIDLTSVTGGGTIPFADLADTPTIIGFRHRMQERIAAEEEDTLAAAVASGVTPSLLEQLHRAADNEPFRERRWHLLASTQAQLGQRREALRTLHRARNELGQVGLDPGPTLTGLERDILANEGDGPAQVVPVAPADRRPIHQHRGDPFVGREAELAQLTELFATVTEEARVHAVIIHGAAGMGKTRLVDRFVESQHDDPNVLLDRVLWGRHREAPSRPHEMFSDLLTRLFDDEPELLGELHGDLAAVGSILPTIMPTSPSLPTLSEAMLQAHIAHGVSSLIRQVVDGPTIWFIDDVQWATSETIDVLERTVESISGPLLIILGTRPMVDGHRGIAILDRLVPTITIDLDPFTVVECADLLDIGDQSTSSSNQVHHLTGGLPLYTSEIARHCRLTGASVTTDAVPGTIRDWVRARVDRLSTGSAHVLRVAAAIGDTADTALLLRAATAGQPGLDAESALDELVAIGLLDSDDPARDVHFSHALTRDLVYEHTGVATRRKLHLTIAERLADANERVGAIDHGALARHYSLAGSVARDLAAQHSRQAGAADLAVGAWSSAIEHFQRAAEGAAGGGDRARALIGSGRGHLGAGQFEAAAAALREAIEISRVEGDPLLQAEATIALVGRAGRGAALDANDDAQIAMIRSALRNIERIDRTGHRLAAILRSYLERELGFALLLRDAADERSELLHSSVARVERLDPVPAGAMAAAVLGSRYAKLGGDQLGERLDDIDRVLSLPLAQVGPENLLAARCYQHEELLRAGDFDAAIDALDHAAAIGGSYPDPYWTWSIATWRGIVELIEGDLDATEQSVFAAHARRSDVEGATACLGVNLVNIRLYQGRSAEVIDLLRGAVAQHPEIPAYRAVLALCASEAGDPELARQCVDWFADARFENLPTDTSQLLAAAVLAHTAADLEHVDAAELLVPILQPFSGQWVVLSCYGGGGASWGPVDHALGRLQGTLRNEQRAAEHFNAAQVLAARSPLVLARLERDGDSLGLSPALR